MNNYKVHLTESAFKHGISAKDILCAVIDERFDDAMDDVGYKRLLLGFDSQARLLEIIYNDLGDQTIRVFHADRCRPEYEKYMP